MAKFLSIILQIPRVLGAVTADSSETLVDYITNKLHGVTCENTVALNLISL
jgi:hypothetical protein